MPSTVEAALKKAMAKVRAPPLLLAAAIVVAGSGAFVRGTADTCGLQRQEFGVTEDKVSIVVCLRSCDGVPCANRADDGTR